MAEFFIPFLYDLYVRNDARDLYGTYGVRIDDHLSDAFGAKVVQAVAGYPHLFRKVDKLTLTISYEIGDWKFVGIINHLRNPAEIKVADDSKYNATTIPSEFYDRHAACDNCSNRIGTRSYLVYDTTSNSFQQYDQACLEEVTGLSAETCTKIIRLMDELQRTSDKLEHPASELSDRAYKNLIADKGDIYLDQNYAKKVICHEILTNGWADKDRAKERVKQLLTQPEAPQCSEQEYNEIDEWANQLTRNRSVAMQWASNAREAWDIPYMFRFANIGLLNSLVGVYVKNKERQAEQAEKRATADARTAAGSNVYAGEVDDTIRFTIRDITTPFYRTTSFGRYPVHRIVDTEGRVIMWITTESSPNVYVGDTLEGKIVKLSTYERTGEKQTFVKRCKVIDSVQTLINNHKGFFAN